jgi:spore maturation protein CgeB
MELLRKEGFTFMSYGKNHPLKKYVEFMNNGRIQFIRSAGKEGIAKSQVEQRFFECLAMGPVLKDYYPDLEKLGLIEGEDFFWYKDDKEMLEKMYYLINNPEFASTMADKGREKALMYHSYSHRLISIINSINEYENK